MSEIFVTNQKIYSINGLAIEDMELLSLALHEIKGDLESPKLSRVVPLIQAIDSQFQPK